MLRTAASRERERSKILRFRSKGDAEIGRITSARDTTGVLSFVRRLYSNVRYFEFEYISGIQVLKLMAVFKDLV